jgi:hypothetical protein
MEKRTKVERDPERPNWKRETTETEEKIVIVEKEVGWIQDTVISREEIKKK